jgi:ribosomal protein S18 acetylase RimI-like enzyme
MNDIRPMRLFDVKDVVEIHLKSFPGFFLTFLGSRFLSEFYMGVLDDPTGLAYVIIDAGCVTGFVAGTSQPEAFYSRLLRRRWWRFAFSALIPVLKNPLIIPRLLRAVRKPGDVLNQPETGTLMSIAVAPESQGQGMGQVLVKTFLKEAINRGLKHIDLTTDKNNNDFVNQFYQRMGFRCPRTFITPEGREMNEYVMDL